MRYLFVTWDGGGNFHCVLPLARRLVARGHDVRFLGNRSQRASIEEAGCSFSPFERAPSIDSAAPDGLLDDWRPRSLLATSAVYRDNLMFGPAPLFAEDVLATVRRDRPDAILVDYMLFGAVAAAESTGLPAAAYWHTAYATPDIDVPVFGLGRGLPDGLPSKLAQRAARMINGAWWNRSLSSLNRTRAGLGLPALDTVFEQFDRLDRVLVMTSASFDFAALCGAHTPANVSYVGPQLDISSLPRGDHTAMDDGGGTVRSSKPQHHLPGPAITSAEDRPHAGALAGAGAGYDGAGYHAGRPGARQRRGCGMGFARRGTVTRGARPLPRRPRNRGQEPRPRRTACLHPHGS